MLQRLFVHIDSLLFTNRITQEAKGDAGDKGGFVSESHESRESVVPAPHLSDPYDAWLRSHRYKGDLSVCLFVHWVR